MNGPTKSLLKSTVLVGVSVAFGLAMSSLFVADALRGSSTLSTDTPELAPGPA